MIKTMEYLQGCKYNVDFSNAIMLVHDVAFSFAVSEEDHLELQIGHFHIAVITDFSNDGLEVDKAIYDLLHAYRDHCEAECRAHRQFIITLNVAMSKSNDPELERLLIGSGASDIKRDGGRWASFVFDGVTYELKSDRIGVIILSTKTESPRHKWNVSDNHVSLKDRVDELKLKIYSTYLGQSNAFMQKALQFK